MTSAVSMDSAREHEHHRHHQMTLIADEQDNEDADEHAHDDRDDDGHKEANEDGDDRRTYSFVTW
jgi:hypothetical protein